MSKVLFYVHGIQKQFDLAFSTIHNIAHKTSATNEMNQVSHQSWKGIIASYPLQIIDRTIQVGWLVVTVHGIDCVHNVLIVALTVFDSTVSHVQKTAVDAAQTLQYGFVATTLVKLFSFF